VERLLLQVFVDRNGIDISAFPELTSLAEHPDAAKVSDANGNAAVLTVLADYAGFLETVRNGDLGKTAQLWLDNAVS